VSSKSRRKQNLKRARYARTDSDLLIGGDLPSGQEPSSIWWMGDDRMVFNRSPGATLAAVTRATSLIADTIGTLNWRVLSGGSDALTSVVELPSPRWIIDPMLVRPDARFGLSPTPAAVRLTRSAFWSQWIRGALTQGCGSLIFEEASDGQPVAGTLRVLNNAMVTPMDTPFVHRRIGSEDGGYVDTDYDGRFEIGGRIYRLVELLNPYDRVDEMGCARGVLEMHAAEFGMALQQVEYGSSTYRSGVPAGYLKVQVPNFSADQAAALKRKWLESHGGDRRSIAVLNSTTDFQPLSMSPLDMELIRSRQMSLIDISNMFGVPVHMLGGSDGSSNTYSNAESRNRDFTTFGLAPVASAAEDLVGSLMPQGQYVEVSFTGLLRSDTATRYAAYSTAIRDGWLHPNEVRVLENLPPIPGTDQAPPSLGIDPPASTAIETQTEEAGQ